MTLERVYACQKLGISLSGGSVVTEVFTNFPATGKVFVGDKVLSVNGMAFVPLRGMIETSGENVRLQLCHGSGGLTVGRPVTADAPPATVGSPSQTRTLVLERKGKKLGFNLEPDGVTVMFVYGGRLSAARGALFAGDRIVSIDGTPTTCIEESAPLLKAAGARVTLEVVSTICNVHTATQQAERLEQAT